MAWREIDPYEFSLLVLGLAMLLAAWLPHLVTNRSITFPIFYVLGGLLLFQLPLWLPDPSPFTHGMLTERLTELTVIVALMGAGLKLDRKVGWRRWNTTWRLLAITMPLTIAAAAFLGWWLMGLGAAAAILLGAVIAPTDPVLASDVQVSPPGEGEEDEVRFSLTSEAGLNDGLAFPFTYLAIGLAGLSATGATTTWAWLSPWLGVDVLYRLAVGVGVGVAVGWLLGRALFRPPAGGDAVASSREGSLALAATFVAYAACELAHGYGFLAVFVAACTIRNHERDHEYHQALHTFTSDVERVLTAILLVLLGGATPELLSHLTVGGAVVALLLVIVVRPITGYVALLGRDEPWQERFAIAFFGIRGIGSIYYLAYAANHAEFEDLEPIWASVTLTILASALIHGIAATPAMRYLDRVRKSEDPTGARLAAANA